MTLRRETWFPAPRDLCLSGDEVHVWRVSLERSASAVEKLLDTLAPDERQRAQRFHFEHDRLRFVVARGVLRDILGRYLRRPPELIRFAYNEYGKPALAEDESVIRFNVSHSQDAALYACTLGREVGVDIEFLRDDFASLEIAERFFSEAEMRALGSLPTHLQTQAFFNCWTRKEAYIKALGEGLSHPLDCFAVSLKPQEPARLISTDKDPSEAARWAIIDLNPFRGYAAAVAVRLNSPTLHCWDWH